MNLLIQVIAFITTILILVSFHEAGHFLVAKLLGVKVIRFSVGFGKKLFRFEDKSGTEYVIALIPLGGYVKLLDEREVIVRPAEKHLTFNQQPLWARTLVVLAGPLTNILFAIAGFWLMYLIGFQALRPIIGNVMPNSIAAQAGLQSGDEIISVNGKSTPSLSKVVLELVKHLGDKDALSVVAKNPKNNQEKSYQLNLTTWSINELKPDPLTSIGMEPWHPLIPPIVAKIDNSGPAYRAGLRVKDRILAIDDKPVSDWFSLLKKIHSSPNKQIILKYQRGDKVTVIPLTVAQKLGWGLKYHGYLGVMPEKISLPQSVLLSIKYPPGKAFKTSLAETWNYFAFNFIVIKKMVLGQISLRSLGGPITIFTTADNAFRQGVSVFLGFLSLISIMLAFINLLPIPGLDGGHLFNFLIEFLTGKPVSLKYEIISVQVGMFLLILLMVWATFNDILRLFSNFR